MDDYKYAVLYKKQVYQRNHSYIFIPCYVIKGIYDENDHIFLDETNVDRYLYSDINIINDASDYCVGNVYTKENLIEKYKEAYRDKDIYDYTSIDEAALMSVLFDETQHCITVGYYQDDSTSIFVDNMEIEFKDIYTNDNQDSLINSNTNESTNNYYEIIKEAYGEEVSIFLPDDIKYIRSITDIEKLKKYIELIKNTKNEYGEKINELNGITEICIIDDYTLERVLSKNSIEEIKHLFINTNQDISIYDIKNRLDYLYNEIQNSDDMDYIFDVCNEQVQFYTTIMNYLYANKIKGITLSKTIEYFKSRLGEIYLMELIQNIDELKLAQKDFYNKSIEDLKEIEEELQKPKDISSKNSDTSISKISSDIDNSLSQINSLVGLNNVKETMEELFDTILYKFKTQNSLLFDNETKHMVFTGNPGTGKTTVASIIAPLFYKLGYLDNDKVAFVSAEDLIAGYVGQTAMKTANLINKNKGGLIVLDEAYILAGEAQQFGNEAVTVLLKEMEQNNTMFIFAGYTKEMESFIKMNSGLESRIGTYIEFKDYSDSELLEIFKKNFEHVNKNNNSVNKLRINDEGLDKVRNILHDAKSVKNFGNGRFAKKLFDLIIRQHAKNVRYSNDDEVLYLITKNDIPNDALDKIFFNACKNTGLYSKTSIGFNASLNKNDEKVYTKKSPVKNGLGY